MYVGNPMQHRFGIDACRFVEQGHDEGSKLSALDHQPAHQVGAGVVGPDAEHEQEEEEIPTSSPVKEKHPARMRDDERSLRKEVKGEAKAKEIAAEAQGRADKLVADPPGGVRPLDDFELASRLSYFLWSSLPDDELLQLAAKTPWVDSVMFRYNFRSYGDKDLNAAIDAANAGTSSVSPPLRRRSRPAGHRRADGVDALAGQFDHDVRGDVDDKDVVAETALERAKARGKGRVYARGAAVSEAAAHKTPAAKRASRV